MSKPDQAGGARRFRVGVAGAGGFAGGLAAWIVFRHPRLDLVAVAGRSDVGRRLCDVHPRYRVPLEIETFDAERWAELDIVLTAYPHGASAPVVAELRSRDVRVVDLSADFRLDDMDVYRKHYGDHRFPDLQHQAVYGLPELNRDAIAQTSLVAGPGCYSTAAILALAPLGRAGLLGSVTIDAKSGVSGAGRTPTTVTHFVSCDENVNPYALSGHRHLPEVLQELRRLGPLGSTVFVPHLVPLDQGLLASCYVTPVRPVSAQEVREIYRDFYAGEAFVEYVDVAPGVRDVAGTNFCRIHTSVDGDTGTVLCFSVIDNLWKGAAGQAVQALNVMTGIDEREGLL